MKIKKKLILATTNQYRYLKNKLLNIGSPSLTIVNPSLADLGISDVLFFKGLPFIKIDTEYIRKKFNVINIKNLNNNFNNWRKAIYKTVIE